MKAFMISVSLGALVAGCATTTSDEEMAYAQERATHPPVCETTAQCDEMWSRALRWVVDNSEYRVQLQTDALIQTYGPTPNSSYPAYLISKDAIGSGVYQISFRAGCDNMFGCNPDTTMAHAAFNIVVSGEN
jgi:hypothetical protein